MAVATYPEWVEIDGKRVPARLTKTRLVLDMEVTTVGTGGASVTRSNATYLLKCDAGYGCIGDLEAWGLGTRFHAPKIDPRTTKASPKLQAIFDQLVADGWERKKRDTAAKLLSSRERARKRVLNAITQAWRIEAAGPIRPVTLTALAAEYQNAIQLPIERWDEAPAQGYNDDEAWAEYLKTEWSL